MNETLSTIHGLRTIHGDFSTKPVSDEDLETIIAASVRAANASARQSYSIVAVSDPMRIAKVCGYTALRMLLYCVDFNRIADTAKHLDCRFEAGDLRNFLTGAIDTVLAAQTAAVAARSLGIETFFTNGIHRGDMQRVYDCLELPQTGCFPIIALLLGYAKKERAHMMGRLSGAGVVHHERYRRLTGDEAAELVAVYDDPERHIGLIGDWQEKGFEHYLEWFYRAWTAGAPPPDEGPPADPFEALVARAGFMR